MKTSVTIALISIPFAASYASEMSEADSLQMLGKPGNNETVGLTMQFEDGKQVESGLYPPGDRDFYVWAAMFRTCIRESLDGNGN